MSVYASTPLQFSTRKQSLVNIKNNLQSGKLTSTDEIIGYTLVSQRVSDTYQPKIPSEGLSRKIAAPEFLTGLIEYSTV